MHTLITMIILIGKAQGTKPEKGIKEQLCHLVVTIVESFITVPCYSYGNTNKAKHENTNYGYKFVIKEIYAYNYSHLQSHTVSTVFTPTHIHT